MQSLLKLQSCENEKTADLTLNSIWQRYWILRGRGQVKRLIRHCIACKKSETLPFQTGFKKKLPKIHVDEAPPFSHAGIDFAGPLLVSGKVKGDIVKLTCLFTCDSTKNMLPNLREIPLLWREIKILEGEWEAAITNHESNVLLW